MEIKRNYLPCLIMRVYNQNSRGCEPPHLSLHCAVPIFRSVDRRRRFQIRDRLRWEFPLADLPLGVDRRMSVRKDSKKPVSRTFRLTDELDRQLLDFKRQTGISQGTVVRTGIELALEKYRPLMAQEVAR